MNPDEKILYNKSGKREGYFQKDVLDENKMNFFENRRGTGYEADGYLKESPLNSDRKIWYDENGNQKGYFEKDILNDRRSRFHEK